MVSNGLADKISADQEGDAPPDPPRRRGRPKGTPKTGGRVKGSKNWTSEERRTYFVEDCGLLDELGAIIKNEPFRASGPTGKTIWKYWEPALRAKTMIDVFNRCWPTETDVTTRDLTPENPDSRKLARVIFGLLSEAKIEDGGDPLPHAPAQAHTHARMNGHAHSNSLSDAHMDVAEVQPEKPSKLTQDGGGSPWGTGAPEEDEIPSVACFDEKMGIYTFPNEATIQQVRMPGSGTVKWRVADAWDRTHGFRTERRAAAEFAQTLPGFLEPSEAQ